MNDKSKGEAISGERQIVITRTLDAPRALVFKVWIDPNHVMHWWGPNGFTNTIHEMDVRPGGNWRFIMHGPDGTDYKNEIVFNEIVEPERLAYSHVSTPKFDAVVTFEDVGGKTKVTMRSTFRTVEDFKMAVEKFGAVQGGEETIDRMAEYALKKN